MKRSAAEGTALLHSPFSQKKLGKNRSYMQKFEYGLAKNLNLDVKKEGRSESVRDVDQIIRSIMNSGSQFRFRAEELDLWTNVLNEVLNGFDVPEFETRIQMSRKDLDNLFRRIRPVVGYEDVVLGFDQTRAFRNALFEVIRELGNEEFQTRTGYTFGQGNSVLKDLDGLLNTK